MDVRPHSLGAGLYVTREHRDADARDLPPADVHISDVADGALPGAGRPPRPRHTSRLSRRRCTNARSHSLVPCRGTYRRGRLAHRVLAVGADLRDSGGAGAQQLDHRIGEAGARGLHQLPSSARGDTRAGPSGRTAAVRCPRRSSFPGAIRRGGCGCCRSQGVPTMARASIVSSIGSFQLHSGPT
jgi:hypothetical protein